MKLDFFTPVNFSNYQNNNCLESLINYIGEKLDDLFYIGNRRFSVIIKHNGKYEGLIEKNTDSKLKNSIIGAGKVALLTLAFFDISVTGKHQTVALAIFGFTIACFVGKCTFRFFNHFVNTSVQEPKSGNALIISNAIKEHGQIAIQNADVMLMLTKLIIEEDENKEYATQVFDLYQIHANEKHPESMYWLANCYLEGYGCDKNMEAYKKWMQESAALGYQPAIAKHEELAQSSNNMEGGLKTLARTLSVKEFSKLQKTLEKATSEKKLTRLEKGSRNTEDAINKLYAIYGEDSLSNAPIMILLANKIIEIDTNKEHLVDLISLYRLHASKGHVESKYRLAIIYLENLENKDVLDHSNGLNLVEEAKELLNQAAEKGHRRAKQKLSVIENTAPLA